MSNYQALRLDLIIHLLTRYIITVHSSFHRIQRYINGYSMPERIAAIRYSCDLIPVTRPMVCETRAIAHRVP